MRSCSALESVHQSQVFSVLLAFLFPVNGWADRFGRRGDERVKRHDISDRNSSWANSRCPFSSTRSMGNSAKQRRILKAGRREQGYARLEGYKKRLAVRFWNVP